MAEGTLARLTVPRATVVDTQLPVTVAEDIRRLLAVMVEAEAGHRTAVEVDPRTAVVADPRTAVAGHRTAVVDLHTVVDMGGNTTLDSWPA
jgi:uncharacterized iron-regulated membrane protein